MAEKTIKKSDWISNFTLIGKAKVNDYTYKLNEKSEKSAWIYNLLNLGVDCGEKYGVCYCELMGGYSDENPSFIYAHGKDEDGKDDFDAPIQVAWEDRLNPEILESVGEMCFITVGLAKTDKGKTFPKKFLSAYDAIEYIHDNLEDGMTINVKGNLKYSTYNGKTQVRKNITSIFLSSKEADGYSARFTQTVLLNKESASLKEVDKETGIMYVDARVLDYVKEINGVEIKGQYPFRKQFEFELNLKDEKRCKLTYDKLFKVKKDVTQITFEGEFIEGGATITMTYDDLPDDIKELIEIGLYTEEEALAKCSTGGNREQKMFLIRPYFKTIIKDETKSLIPQKFEERYTEDDLDFSFVNVNKDEDTDEDASIDEMIEAESEDEDMDWLSAL